MPDNVSEHGTARQATDACRITKIKMQTHTQYLMLMIFPLHQWLRERASILRLHVNCL
jgi:hypothetical protein